MTDLHQQHDSRESENLSAFIQLNKLRLAVYALLARLYRSEIDQATLDELKSTRFPARTGNRDVDEGYRLLASYLGSARANSVQELAIDYARVFIGHGNDGFGAAYPFESVYTSKKRLLMQEARNEVLVFYRKAGLDKNSSWKDPEDHIAIELEFLHILCARAVEAFEKGQEDTAQALFSDQRKFLEGHLINWIPMLTADMKRFTRTSLYKGLAYLTDGFLAVDRNFLCDFLSEDVEMTA